MAHTRYYKVTNANKARWGGDGIEVKIFRRGKMWGFHKYEGFMRVKMCGFKSIRAAVVAATKHLGEGWKLTPARYPDQFERTRR